MFQSFRSAMTWVHTWFGLVLGFVLMAAFFFGSLSVFTREIDAWAIPEWRITPQPMPSVDQVLLPAFRAMQPDAEDVAALQARVQRPLPARFDTVDYWQAFATLRDPILNLYAGYLVPQDIASGEVLYAHTAIDPRDGTMVHSERLALGSAFFYPMHFNLTLHWKEIGAWIVGLSALAMLAALVSGVVMHRKLFRELFTFRPGKASQRSILDLHNLTGVTALPFHFFFAFTGLVIFAGIYFPVTHTQLAPLHDLHEQREAASSGVPTQRAGVAAPLAPVDAMVAEAQRRWTERGLSTDVGNIVLVHVGDANGYVLIQRAPPDRMSLHLDGIRFRAATGEILQEDPPLTASAQFTEFMSGLHLVPFRHWTLRWLYFAGGLAGCICIATGFLFFVAKRKRQHAKLGSQGARCVDALAVTTVTGMVVATLALLVVNRVLPDVLPAGWPRHGLLESGAFWSAWILALAHAFWRTSPVAKGGIAPAWHEQCAAVAVLAIAAVVMNGIGTGDHLLRTLRAAYWPVAAMDLALLVAAALAALAWWQLQKSVSAQAFAETAARGHASARRRASP